MVLNSYQQLVSRHRARRGLHRIYYGFFYRPLPTFSYG
jgi:hypothetical protein